MFVRPFEQEDIITWTYPVEFTDEEKELALAEIGHWFGEMVRLNLNLPGHEDEAQVQNNGLTFSQYLTIMEKLRESAVDELHSWVFDIGKQGTAK